jgi:hypothetical protein
MDKTGIHPKFLKLFMKKFPHFLIFVDFLLPSSKEQRRHGNDLHLSLHLVD